MNCFASCHLGLPSAVWCMHGRDPNLLEIQPNLQRCSRRGPCRRGSHSNSGWSQLAILSYGNSPGQAASRCSRDTTQLLEGLILNAVPWFTVCVTSVNNQWSSLLFCKETALEIALSGQFSLTGNPLFSFLWFQSSLNAMTFPKPSVLGLQATAFVINELNIGRGSGFRRPTD